MRRSRFRYDSELNRIAARLPGGVDVSRTLAMLVARALEAPEWLARRASARLVDANGRVITVGGWPADAELESDGASRNGPLRGDRA